MELNQDEDIGSKMKNEKQESDVFPTQGAVVGSVEIGDQKLGFGEDSDNSKRVCEICGKEFRSGKALGGHMSSHVQLKKNMRLKEEEGEECDFVCAVCDRGFLSMKALSGHMRSHPNRPWRGINPPKTTSSNDVINSPIEQFVDLMPSLQPWPVTAKRGRTAIPAEEGPIINAVKNLMMLARGEGDVWRKKEGTGADEIKVAVKVESELAESDERDPLNQN